MISKKMKDLTDQTFGRLTVLKYHGPDNQKRAVWWCRCECGQEKPIRGVALTNGLTTSCGCVQREVAATIKKVDPTANRHQPEYRNWVSMRNRCLREWHHSYERYGEAGVEIDPAWDDFSKFLEDMGPKPSPEHTIDRIENNKGYCKSNCRWATPTEQVRNRTVTTMVEYKGETRPLAEWAEILNVKYGTLKKRLVIDKMPVGEAFTKPIRKWNKKE